MAIQARDRVRELTALLSGVSLVLVFAAVGGIVPTALLPRIPALIEVVPHVNAAISLAAIGTILLGVYSIRQGNVRRHRAAMLVTVALFAAFLVLYLYRISLVGPTTFPGPPSVYRFVYLPTLAVHVLLAIVCVPLVYYVLLLAATRDPAELPGTLHPTVGRVAATLWLVSFALGVVVYLLLYAVY
jgi:putative membrane protein